VNALCVLYDETCGFCCECARRIAAKRHRVPVHCLPRQAPEVKAAFGDFDKAGTKPELIVIDDDGGIYRDADAWIITLWALEGYQRWATRMARPSLKPFARALFEVVSSNRHAFSKLLALDTDEVLQHRLSQLDPSPWRGRCEGEACERPAPAWGALPRADYGR
jgi:predicted DCC family thiol-disulfide oxidoreductase YuxK